MVFRTIFLDVVTLQEVSYDRITRIDSDDRMHAWASPVTDRQILLQEQARYLVIDTMSLYNDRSYQACNCVLAIQIRPFQMVKKTRYHCAEMRRGSGPGDFEVDPSFVCPRNPCTKNAPHVRRYGGRPIQSGQLNYHINYDN